MVSLWQNWESSLGLLSQAGNLSMSPPFLLSVGFLSQQNLLCKVLKPISGHLVKATDTALRTADMQPLLGCSIAAL